VQNHQITYDTWQCLANVAKMHLLAHATSCDTVFTNYGAASNNKRDHSDLAERVY